MPRGGSALGPTAHVDTFTRDHLPPLDQWPDLLLDRPEFQYPEYLNVAVELTDRMVEKGFELSEASHSPIREGFLIAVSFT